MSSSVVNSVNTARSILEIEFSGKVSVAGELIVSFAVKHNIKSVVLYWENQTVL